MDYLVINLWCNTFEIQIKFFRQNFNTAKIRFEKLIKQRDSSPPSSWKKIV